MKLIERPRCDEADERSDGLNVCGLCECRFTVREGEIVPTVVDVGSALHMTLGKALKEPWCPFCKKAHPGGNTCLGHHP